MNIAIENVNYVHLNSHFLNSYRENPFFTVKIIYQLVYLQASLMGSCLHGPLSQRHALPMGRFTKVSLAQILTRSTCARLSNMDISKHNNWYPKLESNNDIKLNNLSIKYPNPFLIYLLLLVKEELNVGLGLKIKNLADQNAAKIKNNMSSYYNCFFCSNLF